MLTLNPLIQALENDLIEFVHYNPVSIILVWYRIVNTPNPNQSHALISIDKEGPIMRVIRPSLPDHLQNST